MVMETSCVIRIAAAVITDATGACLLVRKQGTTAFMQPGEKWNPEKRQNRRWCAN